MSPTAGLLRVPELVPGTLLCSALYHGIGKAYRGSEGCPIRGLGSTSKSSASMFSLLLSCGGWTTNSLSQPISFAAFAHILRRTCWHH